jgi:hypothetical protein
MHPALEAAGRRLGFALGDPNLEGSIYAISSDHARASDASPWTRAIWWLAVAPTAAMLVALFAAARIASSMLRGGSTRSRSAAPLTYGLGGYVLGDALARRRQTLVQFWRLDTPVGARILRIAIPPSHPSDVRTGDALQCWVRAHRDGTFSVDRADNLTTGERITPQRPSPLLLLAAAVWMAILLIVLLQALLAQAA